MDIKDAVLADARGFMKSRVILTAAELDMFTELVHTPASAEPLAEKLGLDPRACTRILDCLVTFELLDKRDSVYHVTERGAWLSSDHPRSVLPMVLHMAHLWENWSHLSETVRNGVNPHRKAIIEAEAERQKAFIGAMHVVGEDLSLEIADDYDARPFHTLLDVGGASGTYVLAFLKKHPHLKALLFDFEGVIPMARQRLKAEGLEDRVQCVGGDFYHDELPGGCDLALLSAIIHQNSPEQNVELYRKVFRALEPGGALLIRDHIMDETRTHPPAGALFAINMLVNTLGGDTYTFNEVQAHLHEAGFDGIRWVRAGERMDCLVEARKPL
jgi:SAM-dependent methyltransferase